MNLHVSGLSYLIHFYEVRLGNPVTRVSDMSGWRDPDQAGGWVYSWECMRKATAADPPTSRVVTLVHCGQRPKLPHPSRHIVWF